MRTFRFSWVVILSTLVGCSTLLYAQDDKSQDDKPRQEEAKPEPKQDEAKPPRQDETKPAKPEKQEEKQKQEPDQKEPRGQAKSDQPAEHARPAGKGGHIPDDKFRAHFGHSHTFTARTVIVSGQPQFQYSGYTFEFIDPWPTGWAYTDECYIDYIDGEYFLFDLLHPGVRIAVFVVM